MSFGAEALPIARPSAYSEDVAAKYFKGRIQHEQASYMEKPLGRSDPVAAQRSTVYQRQYKLMYGDLPAEGSRGIVSL